MVTDAAVVAGLLADGNRRRVFAALVLGAATVDEVRAATGLGARAAGTALTRLVDGELVIRSEGGDYFVVEEVLARAAREAAPERADEHGDEPAETARVLRAFVRDGRLLSIPASRSKRRVVLDRLAQEFEPGRRYTERQVNATLRQWHEDTAALRRYLVDESFMERGGGEYWRAGGTFAP